MVLLSSPLLKYVAWLFAGLCLLPIVAVGVSAYGGTWETWTGLAQTVMPTFIGNTLLLVLIVGIGTAIIGTSTAWLVSTCQFTGRRVFEIVLALPLAFPAYVLAYAYMDLLDHPGLCNLRCGRLRGGAREIIGFLKCARLAVHR